MRGINMVKKSILSLFVFLLCLAPINSLATDKELIFNDINGHWAKDYILDLYGREIIQPDKNGNFRPDEIIKGYEFTELAIRATTPFDNYRSGYRPYPKIFNLYVPKETKKRLEKLGVKPNASYFSYYEKAIEIQPAMFELYTRREKYILPQNNMTRAEVWQVLSWIVPGSLTFPKTTYVEHKNTVTNSKEVFNSYKDYEDLYDKNKEHIFPITNNTARKTLALFLSKDIIFYEKNSKDEKFLFPKKQCTRAEAAIMISKLISFMETSALEFDGSTDVLLIN